MIHRARQNTNISLSKKQIVFFLWKSVQNLYKKTFIHKSSFVLVKVLNCAKDKIKTSKKASKSI